jgi:hypothetical protein
VITYCCDICNAEIRSPSPTLRIEYPRLVLEIRRSVDGTWNAGHVCTPCLLVAVDKGVVTP